MPTPQYTQLQQQVFTLSMLSNGLANKDETQKTVQQLQQDLANKLKAALNAQSGTAVKYIGNWNVVWGPAVFMNGDSGVADNAMYVAQGTDSSGKTVYVVSVAGTSAYSDFDQMVEDLALQPPMPWPLQPYNSKPVAPTGAVIDNGTSIGLQILQSMTDPTTQKSLQDYLASVQNKNATVIFAGHSLGGALAPTLALALFGGTNPALSTAAWANVLTMPTAGPTPGDAGFVAAYGKVFAPKQYQGQTWNQNVWNSYDIVPHAWSMIGQLSSIYTPNIPSGPCVGKLVDWASGLAAGINFQQLPGQKLTGSFHTPLGAKLLDPLQYYLLEALYQHIWAYFDLLGVPALRTAVFTGLKDPFQDPAMVAKMLGAAALIRKQFGCN